MKNQLVAVSMFCGLLAIVGPLTTPKEATAAQPLQVNTEILRNPELISAPRYSPRVPNRHQQIRQQAREAAAEWEERYPSDGASTMFIDGRMTQCNTYMGVTNCL